MSTIGPVAVGVVLAFAWNMTMAQPQGDTGTDSVTPQVGLTVEQAAAQAWASATPGTATAETVTGGSPSAPGGGTWSASHARGSGSPTSSDCRRAWPLRTPERALQVRVVSACSSPPRVPKRTVSPVRRVRLG